MTISDIQAETRSLCDADSTSYPDAVLLRRENAAYEEIVGKLIARNNKLKFDDTNFSKTPIGYGTLQDGIQEYAYDTTMLTVERVEIVDKAGTRHQLTRIDERNIDSLGEYKKTPGLPDEFAERGNSIFLYCPPSSASVTLVNGIVFYFQRTADIYTSAQVTTGTKSPGFPSPYHVLICYKAALPYCMSYKKERVPLYLNEINRLEKEMLDLADSRYTDQISRIIPSKEDNR